MPRWSFMGKNADRGNEWWKRLPGATLYNELLPVSPAKQPDRFVLMGDLVENVAQARRAFRRGAFMYQYRSGTVADDSLLYCKTEFDIKLLCESIELGQRIVVRLLQPER